MGFFIYFNLTIPQKRNLNINLMEQNLTKKK